jgi:GntR family transcriptional regulator of arabinose operon
VTDDGVLLGHRIISSSKLTFTEQVYDIVCEEIHAGRWKIGEKLPSISSMSEECGLSSMPIYQAVERLQEEGYVRTEQGSGTFLAAVLPKGAAPLGVIGVIMVRHREPQLGLTHDELDYWRMHAIIQEAARRNYTEQIKYVDESYDGRGMDKIGGLFGENVKGIISLHNFPREDHTVLPPDNIPFVYLGYTGFTGRPRVELDLENGFYQLTREVIRRGHRSIVCVGAEPTARVKDSTVVFAGYERAMKEVGLPVNREVFDRSREIPRGEWVLYREFLEQYASAFPAAGDSEQSDGTATAFVCAKSHRAMDLVVVADMAGVAVPEELSVVSFSSPMRTSNPDQCLTGIDYNLDNTITECFDLLFKQMKTRRSDVSVVQVKPLVREGDSLAPPYEQRVGALRAM